MADLIEYALDKYTDFKQFETIATQVLTLEGFTNIIPIGGVDDEGIDAEIVKYYKDEIQKTVFQYTIQENISSKISDTISTLEENSIEYSNLIFVTKNQVNNIGGLKTKARKDHKKSIEIYDRRVFIKHLQTESGLFHRYFPNIKAQLNSQLLKGHTAFSSDDSRDILESTLLKCSLLFTFNSSADPIRKDLFDYTFLALIVSEDKEVSKTELIDKFNEKFGRKLNSSELDAVLERLAKKKLVDLSGDSIVSTELAKEKLEGTLSRINASSEALVDDILSKAQEIISEKLDKKTLGIGRNNIKKSLSAYFSLYGLEYTDSAHTVGKKFGFSDNPDLIQLIRKALPQKFSEAIIYSIGEILKKPSEDQAEILTNWARAYLGVQIMGLDPKLKNIQSTQLAKKTFVIDTDFLLYCLVKDNHLSPLYLRVVDELVKMRCRVIVPESIVFEAIKHAEFSIRSYHYFKNSFDTIDDTVIEEKIGNIYVKGYYQAIQNGIVDSSETGFKNYLDNFYDKEDPYNFFLDVIEQTFKGKVEILEITKLLSTPLDQHKLEELTQAILKETNKTLKSSYRSNDENREVAKTDALLYLVLHDLNNLTAIDSGDIFNGTHYLITSSTRGLKCARKLGYNHNVIAKPNIIISLLERIGKFHASSEEIINLFENPYLIEVVNNSWDDIKTLVEAGISLKSKNIVRLRWDLGSEIKSFLDQQENYESDEEASEEDGVKNYYHFVKSINSKGFELVPETKKIIETFEKLEKTIEEKTENQEQLEKEIGKFGKRRQHYLDRINKGGKKAKKKK
ncbi:MAG: hypothetical protein RIM99_14065 [Cyclobacteriaceae bacterium]